MLGGPRTAAPRSRVATTALALAVCLALAAGLPLSPAESAGPPLSISVSGNRFVNGAGQTIRLLGVNHPSFEYACQQGYAYSDGNMDDADADAIASWNANAVRVPLNEDCWLGINGNPSNSQHPQPALTVAGYRAAVESYVAALNARGIYAILDLHWSAPGALQASGQQPMPDDHSAAFWTSVASTFKSDPAVVFDVFNEPFSPGDPRSGNDPAHPVSWTCWVDGGCSVPAYDGAGARTKTLYPAVGMQTLLDAIRATGASQPVLIGGLDYANDLTGWVDHAPEDPLGQEAASFHNYQGKTCDEIACWNAQIAPVAAKAPVVTGEFDEEVCAPTGFDSEYMTWADQHGVGYLAWGWWVLSPAEISAAGCSAFYLLQSHDGTPAAPNGTTLRAHLLSLPASGVGAAGAGGPAAGAGPGVGGAGGRGGMKSPIGLTRFRVRLRAGGTAVALKLVAAESCKVVVTAASARRYALTGGRPRRVLLGTARARLLAGRPTALLLELSRAPRSLLAAKGSLRARLTLQLANSQNAPTVVRRLVTLRVPRAANNR